MGQVHGGGYASGSEQRTCCRYGEKDLGKAQSKDEGKVVKGVPKAGTEGSTCDKYGVQDMGASTEGRT